jgi:hypothetical protein
LALSGDFARVFTQAWQTSVRGEVTGAMEEERLRGLLGSDYERVEQMRDWIAKHPQRLAVLAQLARRK